MSRSRAGSGRLLDPREPDRPNDPLPAGLRPLAGGLLLVPEAAQPGRLVVFFHGAGGTASSGLTVWKQAAADLGVLVLLPSSLGRTWDVIAGGLGPDVATVNAQLAEIRTSYPGAPLTLSGFSDGASYALTLGLANGDQVDSIAAFSPGFMVPPARAGRPRVWVSHGTADTVLPVERCGRRVAQQLRSGGYDVQYQEFAGGHVITPELVAAAAGSWRD